MPLERPLSAARLRSWAVGWSVAAPTADLADATGRLGFVQADPLRAPARAQDLILRHRVRGYRAGDLERRYPGLGVEEDFLYAYGFVPSETRRLLHPRHDPHDPEGRHAPAGLVAEVLAYVRERGATHPRDLEARFGRGRAVNGWGGVSKVTTHALGQLHYHGLLRVARRVDGVRVYEAAPPALADTLPPAERLRRVALLIARVLAPAPRASLQAMVSHLAHATHGLEGRRDAVRDLLASGELEGGEAEGGVRYVWPAGLPRVGADEGAPPWRRARFLAPFDPVVWDRRRFEHLWGWAYRFEAYTPAAKRRLGHYAMPLLWDEDVVGWVKCAVRGSRLEVAPGFVAGRPPPGPGLRAAFDAEVARLERFLGTAGVGGASAARLASRPADREA